MSIGAGRLESLCRCWSAFLDSLQVGYGGGFGDKTKGAETTKVSSVAISRSSVKDPYCTFLFLTQGFDRVPYRVTSRGFRPASTREFQPGSKTTSSFPSPRWASAGSIPDIPAMPVVTDPLDEIRAILIRYDKGEIGPPGADHEIMAILRKRGHVSKKQIHPMLVCIHRLNRGGMIGTSKGVRTLMDKIAGLHWNDEATAHAICVQLEDSDRTDEDEFRTWCENAGSDFPEVPPGSCKYASFACSHTNCGLRLIFSRCESSNVKLGDGHSYSTDVIRKRDAAYALAVEEGITWLVVPAFVISAYPELIQLWSISRNTAGHVQQPVSEVTGMNLLHSLWTEKLAMNERPDYTTIVMNATRGEPWWHDQVDEFIAFLARHAGGQDNAGTVEILHEFPRPQSPERGADDAGLCLDESDPDSGEPMCICRRLCYLHLPARGCSK